MEGRLRRREAVKILDTALSAATHNSQLSWNVSTALPIVADTPQLEALTSFPSSHTQPPRPRVLDRHSLP